MFRAFDADVDLTVNFYVSISFSLDLLFLQLPSFLAGLLESSEIQLFVRFSKVLVYTETGLWYQLMVRESTQERGDWIVSFILLSNLKIKRKYKFEIIPNRLVQRINKQTISYDKGKS